MRANSTTMIHGKKVILVPYRKKHVAKYHDWMKSPILQQLTASELLTLTEEYEMQLSWFNDDDKCTFIVLDTDVYNSSTHDEVVSMVGDVNLFLNDGEDRTTGELEIMIAEPKSRGKGFGKEALVAMMFYGIGHLKMSHYTAKIGYDNRSSINLFEKLGFHEVERSEVFREVTLQLNVSTEFLSSIREYTQHLSIVHSD